MSNFFKISFIIIYIFFSKIAFGFTSSLYLMSNQAFSSFDYDKASNFFAKQESLYLNFEQYSKKIISYVNSDKLMQAAVIAQQAIELDKSNQEAWLVLLTLDKANNSSNNFVQFEKIKNQYTFNIIDYVFYQNDKINKDHLYYSDKFFNLIKEIDSPSLIFPESIDYYFFYLSLSLFLNENLFEALFVKAQLYKELKYYLKSEKFFSKINLKNPLYLEAQKNIVLIKKNTNKFKEAEEILISLIDNYKDDYTLISLLADLYRSNKKYSKAIDYYTLLIKNKKITEDEIWKIYYMRGMCYERSNKWKKAENDFLKALKIEPEQPQVLNYLAYGWIEKDQYLSKSLQMLEMAVKINPESHYILDSLAWAHYKLKNYPEAVRMMEKVIELAPYEAVSLDHLGDIYFALGRKREAYFMWNQALDFAELEDNIKDKVIAKLKNYNVK